MELTEREYWILAHLLRVQQLRLQGVDTQPTTSHHGEPITVDELAKIARKVLVK